MAVRLVAQVQRVVLRVILEFQHARFQRIVTGVGATLRALGSKPAVTDAHRHAGAAVIAVGTIGKRAAAAEADLHQLAVNLAVDRMAGVAT